MKKTLAVIFGGEGEERHISELSAANVIEKIEDNFNLITIGISPSADWFVFKGDYSEIATGDWIKSKNLIPVFPAILNGKSGFYTDKCELIAVDLAFPILHGNFGEDGTVQGTLNSAHIKYIGSKVLPSAITSDKALTKIVAEHLGLPTLPWFIPSSDKRREVRIEAERRLGYPFFIKPRDLGSSIGAAPVYSPKDFNAAFDEATKTSARKIMIESLADVKLELELALFDNGEMRFISNPGAIYSNGEFYSFSEKYSTAENHDAKASVKLNKSLIRKVRTMSRKIADFLELGNISRVDFFLTRSDEIFFNEINSIPGMTNTSLYPAITELYGKFDESFVEELANSDFLQ